MPKIKLIKFLILLKKFVLMALIFIFLVYLFINLHARAYIYKNATEAEKAEVALIPGAAILSNGQISSIFKDRVNLAIELYKLKKVSKILVSGDNSTVSYNEVNPVRIYLLQNDIPDKDIFLDHAGFNTYSTMYRARDIFQVPSVIIATQSFHLPRAIFIARTLGIEAYGVSADQGHILFKNYVREFFADQKAILNLIFHTKPKYMGDVISIQGDGRNYP